MTSIIIWKNNENGESLWAVSDSRVTGEGEKPMVEACPKLYAIPIQIQPVDTSSFQLQVSSFGFCFAGSTLIGQTAYQKLSMLMTRLRPLEEMEIENPRAILPRLPTLENISNILLDIVANLVADICNYKFLLNSQSPPMYEVTIFGYCHKINAFKAYSIKSNSEDPLSPLKTEVDLNKFHIMGCKQEEILEKIITTRNGYDENTLSWWRAPYEALKNILSENEYNTIGGEIQVAKSYDNGTEIYFPIEKSKVVESTLVLGGFFSGLRKMIK